MRFLPSLACCLTVGLALASPVAYTAVAQGTSPASVTLAPGARVRVTRTRGGRRVARLVAVTAETLTVQWARKGSEVGVRDRPYGDTLSVATADIERLDVSAGQRRRTWHGLRIGLLAGTGVGARAAVGVYRAYTKDDEAFFGVSRGEAAAGVVAAGGVLGACFGGVSGAQPREHWREVTAGSARGRVGFTIPQAGRGGVALAVALAF
jgi:hypothetical protein